MSELGLTQYNLGAVVFTLKAIGVELGFSIRMFCLTTRVKGPIIREREICQWFCYIFIYHINNLRSKVIEFSRSSLIDINSE